MLDLFVEYEVGNIFWVEARFQYLMCNISRVNLNGVRMFVNDLFVNGLFVNGSKASERACS